MNNIRIVVSPNVIDIASEINLLKTGKIGALANFIGMVRDNADATLETLTLEHYPQMTEKKT